MVTQQIIIDRRLEVTKTLTQMSQNVNTLKRHYESWQDRPIEVLARTGPSIAEFEFYQTVEFLEEQCQILHTTLNADRTTAQIDFNFYEFNDQDGDGVLNVE